MNRNSQKVMYSTPLKIIASNDFHVADVSKKGKCFVRIVS